MSITSIAPSEGDAGVMLLVLLAAVLHASWNALVKSGSDKLAGTGLVLAFAGLPGLVLLPFVPLPAPAAWPYFLISLVFHCGYSGCLVLAYREGDLSQVYPIARGAAPLLVGAAGWAVAGESLNAGEAAGIAIAGLGIMSLGYRRGGSRRETVSALFALGSGICIAGYSVSDGLGGRANGHALGYVAWLFVIEAPALLAVALWRRRGRLRAAFGPLLLRSLCGGMIAAAAYGIVIWAMARAPLAHVVALRETSVVLAALLGTLVMGEPFGRRRLAASVLVAGGAALLQFSA